MVVKMMRWRPWPPLMSKKFEVKLVVKRLQGCVLVTDEVSSRLMVEIRWKGSKNALSSLRRTFKRNSTKDEELKSDGVVEWNEEFCTLCTLSAYKENAFHPWEVSFTVLNVVNQGAKNKNPVVGTALLNLSEYASAAGKEEFEVNVPLTLTSGDAEPRPSICLSFGLLELRTTQELSETVQRSVSPVPLSPRSETLLAEKDELSALKAGLRKVKILKNYVSTRRVKKASEEEDSEGRCSGRSDDGDFTYPFDTDSLDDCEEAELEDNKDDLNLRKSFSYGTLAHANGAGGSYYSDLRINGEPEDWIYYSYRKSDVSSVHVEDTTSSVPETSRLQSSKRSLLSWRKRKLSFRSPKAKGEPLLKKAYGEEGGDDIDFDRRQLNSSDESLSLGWQRVDEGSTTNRSSISEFGDDNFAVGSWEHKDVVSRDGNMKLSTQVFFASIDQRSERAAGESACTALVAVIADWFQSNQDHMPIRSQFDSLIREGSLEWRNLCENETYRKRFPDKHFDLETVLQAKIRPLTVAPEKSFVGFFHPDGMEEGSFDFLHGAMSFDGIWDEISHTMADCSSSTNPQIFIVSWNDHFFILIVEPEAYYIIDTLGERLYEGCDQAYILKFDRETTIYRLPPETQSSEVKPGGDQKIVPVTDSKCAPKEATVTEVPSTKPEESGNGKGEGEEIICKGKESCKDYIKSFLAAIPIRELQVDIKKGLMDSTPLHQRLQIEFHYTQFLAPTPQPQPQAAEVAVAVAAAAAEVAAC